MTNKTLLHIHEWMAVVTIMAIMAVLTVFVAFKQNDQKNTLFPQTSLYAQDRVEAIVKGAVEYPGIYSLPKETPLKELLAVATLTAEADVRRFNLNKTIQQGRSIHIAKRPMIAIHILGAVPSPQTLNVPQGTRVEELLDRLILEEDADIKILQKKRKLKDGESITILNKRPTKPLTKKPTRPRL